MLILDIPNFSLNYPWVMTPLNIYSLSRYQLEVLCILRVWRLNGWRLQTEAGGTHSHVKGSSHTTVLFV